MDVCEQCHSCRFETRWAKQVCNGCQNGSNYESRKEHAAHLLAQFNKILDEACKSCINHFSCYQQKKNGELYKKHKRCSKKTFEQKIALIGSLCIYHPTLNPNGYKIKGVKY